MYLVKETTPQQQILQDYVEESYAEWQRNVMGEDAADVVAIICPLLYPHGSVMRTRDELAHDFDETFNRR